MLQDQLDAIAAKSKDSIPAEAAKIMRRSIDDLRQSAVLKSPIAPGSALPPFSLPDAEGRTHSRDDVQGAQWLVISLYRGRW
jgi:hypothetical protein